MAYTEAKKISNQKSDAKYSQIYMKKIIFILENA